jgi:nitrogen-specific signal transduction histidine kinase/CheY-like chemotaxis protein
MSDDRTDRKPDGETLLSESEASLSAHVRRLEEQLRRGHKTEALGRLAAATAYDFNNRLALIATYTTLLLERSEDDSTRCALEETLRAAHEVLGLTRQLLSLSRPKATRTALVDLNNVVRGFVRILRRALTEEIDFVTVFDDSLGHVRVFPGQLEQVLMQLAFNARDAMPAGGTLTIETANVRLDESFVRIHPRVVPGAYVALTVTDTGVGMDAATQAQVFEPFFTTKDVGRGSGLGLSTVQDIVRESGGHIHVHSEVGRGATFEVYLPRVDESRGAARARESESLLPAAAATILVVEENPVLQKAVGKILGAAGYRILEANGASTARAVCEEHAGHIDLLLTDVAVEGTTGPELADELAKSRPNMKILYLVAHPAARGDQRSSPQSELVFTGKSLAPDSLVQTVKAALARIDPSLLH